VTAIVRLTMLDGWLHVGHMHDALVVRVHDRDHGTEWTIGVGSELVELELHGAVATPRTIPMGVELVVDDYDTGVFGEAFRCGDDGLPCLARPGVWDQLREAA
jgi:hypothetical protein